VCAGGAGNEYIPNASLAMIYAAGLLQLSNYVRHEWEEKSVRVNEVVCYSVVNILAVCITHP